MAGLTVGRAVAELLLLTRAGCFQGNQPEACRGWALGDAAAGVRPGEGQARTWGGCVQDADSWMSYSGVKHCVVELSATR